MGISLVVKWVSVDENGNLFYPVPTSVMITACSIGVITASCHDWRINHGNLIQDQILVLVARRGWHAILRHGLGMTDVDNPRQRRGRAVARDPCSAREQIWESSHKMDPICHPRTQPQPLPEYAMEEKCIENDARYASATTTLGDMIESLCVHSGE